MQPQGAAALHAALGPAPRGLHQRQAGRCFTTCWIRVRWANTRKRRSLTHSAAHMSIPLVSLEPTAHTQLDGPPTKSGIKSEVPSVHLASVQRKPKPHLLHATTASKEHSSTPHAHSSGTMAQTKRRGGRGRQPEIQPQRARGSPAPRPLSMPKRSSAQPAARSGCL